MKYPSWLELLEFFASEPEEIDDIQIYRTTNSLGLCLSVSFDTSDDSFQTALSQNESTIAVVSFEKMERMHIEGEELHVSFGFQNPRVRARVRVSPNILVEWSGLRTIT